jgi:diguanylate cyclase (GGDEF)-like protein/PAS domain S-box-containing protein
MCLDVTKRKEAEGLNQRFAQIIEASSDLIAISTPEGKIEYINQAGRALLGIGSTEPLQEITVERCHPPAAYRRVVEEGIPVATAHGRWLGENILLNRDGTEVPVSQNILVQRDPQTGEVIFISTVCRDTTEYHRARRALEQAELRYRIIAEFTYDWETWERPDGSLAYVSPACKRVTGYSPAEFYADPALKDSIVLEEDQNLWAAHRHRSSDVADSKVIEIRIKAKDGREVWIEHACQPVHDETGAFLGFRASNRDVTERKRAEDGLRESEDRYRQQWEELHAIYESAAVGLCVLDRDLRYVRINHRLAEIHGIPANEHLGKTPRQLLPALASKAEEIAEHIFRTGEAVTDVEFVAGAPSELTLPRTWIEHWRPLKDSDGHVTGINVVAEDITLRKAAEEEIKRLAFHDPLTQLANRRLLLDRLQQALATSTRNLLYGALLFIDLDNFKTLNDALGHDSGDQLLQQVAKRLVGCVRESDTVARFGGDEFVVMLKDLPHSAPPPEAQAKIVAEKILAALDQPYSLAGGEYPITPSIGITLFINHRNTVDELLKQADLAMYEAKAAGRNTYRFFDPVMQQALDSRSLLETELRVALRDHQLLLHYQPQVDGDGKVRGVEALLRWLHPRQGILLPAVFLPLAEDTGLIRPLGRWVIDTACRQLAAWAHDHERATWTMAINVSGRQFRHPDFADEVLAVLDHTGADPRKLKLELTESILLDDTGDAMAKMRKLKVRGIGFSLDDFGTGFSSLSFLTQLPLDELKIAGTFVKDVCTSSRDAEIARIVLSLGRNLGISVIAEGVETPAQESFLARHGCKAFQGYLFGRPEPV